MNEKHAFSREILIERLEELNKKDRRVQIQFLCVLGLLVIAILSLIALGIRGIVKAVSPTERVVNIELEIDDSITELRDKEDMVFNALIEAGYSTAGACGIMGNIAVESPDYDPTAVGGNNRTYGLFQWNDVGGRRDNLTRWCEDNELDEESIEGQLKFAMYELKGGDPIAKRLDRMLITTDDVYEAASEFAAGFERCVADSGKNADIYMGSVYPEYYGHYYQAFSKRINKAMNYYLRYGPRQDSRRIIN